MARKVRGKKEGENVAQRFGNTSNMDQESVKNVAELINSEILDIISFEAEAGAFDNSGQRPALQAIQERRQASQGEALTRTIQSSSPVLPVAVLQPEAAVILNIEDQSVGQRNDIEEESQTSTPSLDRPATATTVVTSSPIGDPAQQATINPSPTSTSSSHSTEFSSSSDPSDHSHQHHQQDQASRTSIPFTTTALVTMSESSSRTTPTQASFDASNARTSGPPAAPSRPRWQDIKWTYTTHTFADIELSRKGIWLFEKPLMFTTDPSNNGLARLQVVPELLVAVSSDWQDRPEPCLEFCGTALTMYSHHAYWTGDDRSVLYNFGGVVPDYASEVLLSEYQVIEAIGSHVWRHDRDMLPCRGPRCNKMLADGSTATLICLGCGPKSIIRFCSLECHYASLPDHAVECWSPQLLINKIIDHNTTPGRFSHFTPAIRDRHGYRAYHNYRQRVAAQYAGNVYTLFNPATEEPTALYWDQRFASNRGPEVPYPGYAAGMESRIERCLNIALFDHENTAVVEHLYRLIQLCLRVKNSWTPALATILSRQFLLEFNWDANTSLRVRANEPFCECEWLGGAVQQHQSTCSSRYRGQGELIQGQRSVKALVESMENKHWILRAWRTQHWIGTTWTNRVMGMGFPGAVMEDGWMPKVGKGWLGFSAEEDDVCGNWYR
ncbi:MAG: hypothetical protein Q9166_000248 [cf. Caloplaca sp. 2 TL-2023]